MSRTQRTKPEWAWMEHCVYALVWSNYHNRFVDAWQKVKLGTACPIDIRSNKFLQGRDGILSKRDRCHSGKWRKKNKWHKHRAKFRNGLRTLDLE